MCIFFLIFNFILKIFFPVFRQKRSAPKEEPEKIDEEEWNMKDVIFVEDSRNMPIGRVIKVDGQHTVVHFPVGGEKNPPVPAGPTGAPPAVVPTSPAPAPPPVPPVAVPASPASTAAAPTPPPPAAPGANNQTPTKKDPTQVSLDIFVKVDL